MKRFNIRVYAIIVKEGMVLLSTENRFGRTFTKFPGGGLEWGEGTADCVQRELKEEMNIESEVGSIFYVNDFFQQSAFNENDSLISFYYNAIPKDFNDIIVNEPIENIDGEIFHWKSISELSENDLTFPVDKIVAKKLTELL